MPPIVADGSGGREACVGDTDHPSEGGTSNAAESTCRSRALSCAKTAGASSNGTTSELTVIGEDGPRVCGTTPAG